MRKHHKKQKAGAQPALSKGQAISINPMNGQLHLSTIEPHLQDAVKVILKKDVDFIRLLPVYSNGKGQLVAHSNWLKNIPNIPDNLTVVIDNGCLIEAIAEDQDSWRLRYGRITYRGFRSDALIAYVEVKQAAIRAMMGVRS